MAETKVLIETLECLAETAKNTAKALLEAAERLKNQQKRIRNQRREIEALRKDKHRVDVFVRWLDAEIKKLDLIVWLDFVKNEKVKAFRDARKQLEKLRNGLGEQKAPITRPAQAESIVDKRKQ